MTEIIKQDQFLRETIELRNQIEGEFLNLGARLFRIYHENLFVKEYDDFESFLLELKISKATASKLMTVYETFVLTHNISTKKLTLVGWSSLYAAARFADTKEKAEDLVERAGLLTRSDLQRSLTEERGGKNCVHTNAYVVTKCPDCGHQERVYEK